MISQFVGSGGRGATLIQHYAKHGYYWDSQRSGEVFEGPGDLVTKPALHLCP